MKARKQIHYLCEDRSPDPTLTLMVDSYIIHQPYSARICIHVSHFKSYYSEYSNMYFWGKLYFLWSARAMFILWTFWICETCVKFHFINMWKYCGFGVNERTLEYHEYVCLYWNLALLKVLLCVLSRWQVPALALLSIRQFGHCRKLYQDLHSFNGLSHNKEYDICETTE